MMWPKEEEKSYSVRSRHAEEKVSLGAVFGAGLGVATNYVCVSEPRGQGKLTPPPPIPRFSGGVCPRHNGTRTPV